MPLSAREFFIVLLLVQQSFSIFQRKCMVVDDKKDHPERARMPSQVTENDVWEDVSPRDVIPYLISCVEKYDVPIAWHVIVSTNGIGNVSDAKVREAMKVLNDGFKDSRLHFRLHSIQRITNDDWNNACVREKSSYMEKHAITPATVLNLYTCTFDLIKDQIVGNAALPWSYDPDSVYNGVVIHPETLPGGSIQDLNHGKNLVHEVGHYFGLLHYFENRKCDGAGDMVDDTPISSRISYTCSEEEDSCPDQPGLDPVHNFMGYAKDVCLVNFTKGQLERMSWIVDMYKKDLKTIVYRPCSIDSVFRWSDGWIYFFSGTRYYRYNEVTNSIDSDYPRAIRDYWRGVPDNIDGVFRYSDDITYFFKGSEYYKFDDVTLKVESDYPKKIKDFWKGIPNDIGDVIKNSNGFTYFFKKGEYYRFNPIRQSVDVDFPKSMDDYWKGIPGDINAAFTWYNGGVYFFKDEKFWLFKMKNGGHNAIKPSYPKSIKVWWNDLQDFTGYSVFSECKQRTYFVSGDQYWEYNYYQGNVDLFSPLPIWSGIPRKVDGMFVWSDKYLYVFSGKDYYLFDQKTKALVQGYPQKIASFWKGIPDNIDAVFRSSNDQTYFFKGSHYYRFNDTVMQVDSGYPRLITEYWHGVPNDLDTVFHSSNDQVYFFKGNNYYRFNFTKEAVDDEYPRHIAEGWKGMLYNPWFVGLVLSIISISGLEINLSKRRCLFSHNLNNLPPSVRVSDRQSHNLVSAHDQPKGSCQQRYIVPVVWHVIIDSNKLGDVSDVLLQTQVDILNGAFENTSLIFKMDSVKRVINDTWTMDCLGYITQFQEILAESTDVKLNLYTCLLKDPNVLGHSSYPWSHDEDSVYNGVIIHPGTLPGGDISPINEGDNLVHEVGHYFGLLHTFEGGCEGGDSVADTPATGYPTYNCPDTPVDSCPDIPGYDPIHNYMGYNPDSCINHFTPGQVKRLEQLLGQYRENLKGLKEKPCAVDSVFRWSDGYVYLFAGAGYYRYNEISRGIDSGYPRRISDNWHGVPNNIDGVFRYANGYTYFFKGSDYYRFNDVTRKVDAGYPKKIKSFWKGIPNNIDDVIRYSNGLTYFFKNGLYYRFNSTTAAVDIGYPKKIEQYWIGVPKKVQAAFTWYNGGVYFFKDSEFWLFVPGQNSTEGVYPKSLKHWWTGDQHKYQNYNAFRHLNAYTYFVSNKQYWRYNDFKNHIDYTYPHPLTNWLKLPATIDDLFVWSDGQLYAFSGQYYYQVIFHVNSSQSIIVRNISSFWHGVPNNIDAVFRANDGLTYFFKDSQYYRFNDSKRQVDTGYPKPISSFWKGIPNDIDTVFRWSNGQTYFFRKNNYYRFNSTYGAVDDGYPRKIAGAWRGVMYTTNS
ncbi:uncharacterized protein LOC114521531 [Dendronephthya gigantea]|uniref:uncharacterized protein LOC114521531 n=1 Tax=Dendronephthya gigantea TaxID=151771 RepID=UPI001069514C|nr:uncharacterized protein LOC114521531 [Dendronephthya gigantea]